MSHEQLQTAPQPHELNSAGLLPEQYTDLNGYALQPGESLRVGEFGVADYSRQEKFVAANNEGVGAEVEGVPVLRIDQGDGSFTDIVDIGNHPQELEPGAAANYAAVSWEMTDQGWRTTGIEPVVPGQESSINRDGFAVGIGNDGALSIAAIGAEPAKVSLLAQPDQQFVRREAVVVDDAELDTGQETSETGRVVVAHGMGIIASRSEVEMSDDERRFLGMHGIKERAVSFTKAVAERLREGSRKSPIEVKATDSLLKEHGVSADPNEVPASSQLALLKPIDWNRIRTAKEQVLGVWSKVNARSIEVNYQRNNPKSHKTPQEVMQEEALFKSLPLLHSTSAEALYAALEAGTLKSNRQLVEEGIDVTAGVGNTHELDRTDGLDNYVFADFGRPASKRPEGEVTIVLEAEALQQEGAFLTEHDLQDCKDGEGDIDYETYLKSTLLPEDFDEVGLKRILAARSMRSYYAGRGLGENYRAMSLKDFVAGSDSDPANGQAQFSTWEVKMPAVSTEHIRKVVFTNRQQFEDFRARYGDRIASELADPAALKAGVKPTEEDIARKEAENRQLYGIDDRYREELSKLYDADYQKRQAVLQGSQVSEGYVLLNHPDPDSPDAAKHDPAWYRASKRTYTSAEEALQIAQRNYDPGGVRYRQVRRRNRDQDFDRRTPEPEALIFRPKVTVAKVEYAPDGTAVIKELSVEDVDGQAAS